MSQLRLGRLPDGSRDIRIVDDGAVGRISHTRYGVKGGGLIVAGAMAVGESQRTIDDRARREYNARRDREAKAAADSDYYQRNKAAIMAKQRERRSA